MSHAGPDSNAKVAVVVLNWRKYEETEECLESLLLLNRPTQLYLVDNERDPESLERLKVRFPTVVCLPQHVNLGYAAGMNRGIEAALEAGADFVMLFNNDARATPTLVEQLLAMFGMQKDTGIAGPSLRYPPPDRRVQSVGIDVNRVTGRVHLRFPDSDPVQLYPYPYKVDAAPGAALLISAKVFHTVGLLDPDYFFYFEDIDLCLRARDAGLATYINPNAVAYHVGGVTMGNRPVQAYYGVRNQLKLIHDHGVKLPPPLSVLRTGLVAGMQVAQVLREGRVPALKGLGLLWEGLRDHRSGRGGPHPSDRTPVA